MKNICFFNSVSFWGGGEKLHLEFALEFKSRGYNVVIACEDNSPLHSKATSYGIPVACFKISNLTFANPFKFRGIHNFFDEYNIDTLFYSTSQDFKAVSLPAKSQGVKNIIYLRGLASKINNSLFNKYLLKNAVTHFIANSNATLSTALQHFQSHSIRDNSFVIYHGINLDDFDTAIKARQEILQTDASKVVIGTAGRLTDQKGHVHLIRAIKHLTHKKLPIQVLIAGSGPLHDELQQLIDNEDLHDCITLCGFIDNVPEYLDSLDVFALPSLWEGFGYAIVEAMAASKPVVAFNLSSNPEIILDDVTGILVDPVDDLAFSDALERLIVDKDLRNKLGNLGRDRVEQHFQLEQIIDQFEALLS